MEKISVIIPVYNSETYISRCLESIINQEKFIYEIVIIDDGSTDMSRIIIERYLKKTKKIKYFYQENHGVSFARNKALKLISGDLVVFADSDDLFAANAFEMILNNMKNFDLLCYGYDFLYKDSEVENLIGQNCLFDSKKITELVIKSNEIGGYLWNKVFRSKIIMNYDISFDDSIHFSEDLLFVCNYLNHCKKIYYLNLCLYNYRMRKSSVSGSFYKIQNVSVLKTYEILAKKYRNDKNIYDELCYQYILNYYKLKKYIKKSGINLNVSIINKEKTIMQKRSRYEKFLLFLIKYFPSAYIRVRNLKNKRKLLFD